MIVFNNMEEKMLLSAYDSIQNVEKKTTVQACKKVRNILKWKNPHMLQGIDHFITNHHISEGRGRSQSLGE